MGNAYVYYSYEQWGRGYIGARNQSPVGDDAYVGSFCDKTFCPTEKIVLAEFDTMKEALDAEVALHSFYDVAKNPHFANKAKQTSSGFYYDATGRVVSEEERAKGRAKWTPERRQAQAERMAAYNKTEHHRESVVKRNKEHRPYGNRSRTGMKNSDEMRKRISEGGKGRVVTPEQRENYRKAALERERKKRGGKI